MKNEKGKVNQSETKTKKTGPGSNPENKFKKGVKPATAASLDNIIHSAVQKVKPKTGDGLADEGTIVNYDEERL